MAPVDRFYSDDDGLAESRHVFLRGNQLPEAWRGRNQFTVSELGFGTGLNLLALVLLGPPPLLYQSVEWDPLPAAPMKSLAVRWPELAEPARELLEVYDPHPGWNRWAWRWGDICLFQGDARELPSLATTFQPADAWFLDGFAPDRNPELWDAELLQWVGRMTKPGGSAATYSAAGVVKRGLRDAGFFVQRTAGWGKKRHMVRASR